MDTVTTPPLSIGVTVDLEWTPNAGGHVKCWERFAEAAAALAGAVDLTVYVLGREEAVRPVAANSRFVEVPPAFGSARLPFVRTGTGQTDLARRNRRLARRLAAHDVLHATHSFALSRTAVWMAARLGRPLVSSIHTDLAVFTPVYTRRSVEALLGRGVGRWVIEAFDLPRRSTAGVLKREAAILRASQHIFITNPADRPRAATLVGDDRVSHLRRGIDRGRFHPAHRDTTWLAERFGVPPGRPVVLFAGRVDETKGALLAAEAVGRLVDEGVPLHFLVLGDGAEAPAIARRLGADATLAGAVPQETVARAMAGADLFLFPSRSEVLGNVVLEAKAAGLPVLVSDHPGTAQNIRRSGEDGLVVAGDRPADWAEALRPLATDAALRQAMGQAARADVEARIPDWLDVLKDDLLPVWRSCAAVPAANR